MNTYTMNHTARPSRVRIARALLASWYEQHAHTFALAYVGAIVATFAAITAVAMRIDMGATMAHAVTVALLIVGVALFASMLAHMLATSRAEEMANARESVTIAEMERRYDAMRKSYEYVRKEHNDLLVEMDYLATHR